MEYMREDKSSKKMVHRQISPSEDPELNPCLEESLQSIECVNKYPDNKDVCELFFENYRLCQRFWNRVKKERKAQGIEPELPRNYDPVNLLI